MQILADIRNAAFLEIPTRASMNRWDAFSQGPGESSLSLLPTPQALGELHKGGVALVTEVERSLCGPAHPSLGLVVPLRDPLRFLAANRFLGNS
jgi:hypothetical protein